MRHIRKGPLSMSEGNDHPPDISVAVPSQFDELKTFLFLTVVFAPATAVAVVGGFGFVIWMMQIIAGPPS
jgi:nitrate reductase NapE